MVGLKFNMDDRKVACVEVEYIIHATKAALQSVINQQIIAKLQVFALGDPFSFAKKSSMYLSLEFYFEL
jgi:hypothetical protein